MKRSLILAGVLLAVPFAALGQQGDWSAALTSRLEAKASKTVDVSLDQSMLKFASQFLDTKDPDQAQAKKIVSNMQGIYVHSFEFDKPGEYTEEDVAYLRGPLKDPPWSRIVSARSKRDGENVEVYFKKEGAKFTGLVVIATQPTSLTFVSILGPIDPDDLAKLGGHFGIPPVEVTHGDKDKEKMKDKDKKGEDQ